MDILSQIIEYKRTEIEQPDYFQTLEKVVDELPHVLPSEALAKEGGGSCDTCDGKPARCETPDFIEALTAAPVGLIAEVKRQSPSAGPIREPFEPAEIAKAYEAAGAQA